MGMEATKGSSGVVVDFQEGTAGVSTISPNIPKIEDPKPGTGFIADAKTKAPDADIKTRWNRGSSGLLTASKATKVADAKPAAQTDRAGGLFAFFHAAQTGKASREEADFIANVNTIFDQAGGEDKKALS